MSTRIVSVLLASVLMLLLMIGGCGQSTSSVTEPESTTSADSSTDASVKSTSIQSGAIKIGATLPLSGWGATYGQQALQGLNLALDEANVTGAIKVELIVEDTAADAKTAVSATQKLLSVDRVNGLVGTLFTQEALAEASLLTEAKIPMILGQASSPAIPVASEYIFMPHPTTIGYYETEANYGYKVKNVNNLAFLGPDNDMSRAASDTFESVFTELGGKLVTSKLYPQGTTDFKTLLAAIADSGSDGVFLNGSAQDIANILRQAAEVGLEQVWLASSQAADPIVLGLGELSEGLSYCEASPSTESGNQSRQEMIDRFTTKFGNPPETVTPFYAYDSMKLFIAAVEAVGTDGEAIKDWLMNQSYEGVSGEMAFNGTNVAEMTMWIFEAKDGEFVQMDFSMKVK